jgi:hypothetical protein
MLMKKNIIMIIKKIDSKNLINEDIFIKPEIYEDIKKEFDYNRDVVIKDLNFILNIISKYIVKFKFLLIILILLVMLLIYIYNLSKYT